MKALFFRNMTSLKELKKAYDKYAHLGQNLEYEIVEKVKLNNLLYEEFVNKFLQNYSFINEIKKELTMDESDKVNCLLVQCKGQPSILVYSAGYPCARYVAIL
jgi:hypothetical protein